LNVDVDFYAEFSFKHFQIFEYTKSRTINYTASSLDVAADQKAQLAEQVRTGLDSPHFDSNSHASNQLLANDGKDVDANRQAGSVKDRLTLTMKRYDELSFRRKSQVEIEEIQNEKKKLGQAGQDYRLVAAGGQHH
jgi:hypothetical protein